MIDKAKRPEKVLSLQVNPEREELVRLCYKALGYRLEKVKREEHADKQMIFLLESAASVDLEKMQNCRAILEKLTEVDKRVTRYYLERVVLVGLSGAVCIGFSFLFLHLGWHILFTLSLLVGLFGCSITLALRPPFIRMGLKRFGGEIPHLEEKLRTILAEKED